MRPILNKTIAAAVVLALASANAHAGGIDCRRIGFAYDDLFRDNTLRVEEALAEYRALPPAATEQERDAVRKKFCVAAGESIGLYKLIRALARDCQAQGEPLADGLLEIVRQQLLSAQQGINAPCFGLMSAT
jgi:hypothetical protein